MNVVKISNQLTYPGFTKPDRYQIQQLEDYQSNRERSEALKRLEKLKKKNRIYKDKMFAFS